MSVNAYDNYLKQEISGASQGKLIVMMYDACIRFIRLGMKSIEEKNVEQAHNNIVRAENIIYELMATLNLDEGGDIASELMRIYDFSVWHLVDANNSKSKEKLEEVLKVLLPLREAWKEVILKDSPQVKESKDRDEKPSNHKPINFSG